MALSEELRRIAQAGAGYAGPREELVGVVPAEPATGERIYLCAFRGDTGETSWIALDGSAQPVDDRTLVRDAASIAAMCELAEELAAGGDLDELRSRLVALRLTENPPGIDDAEAAILKLQAVIGAPPHVATPARLDELGAATRRLELTLGDPAASPFAEAMKQAVPTVDAVASDVEANYKRQLQPARDERARGDERNGR